MGGTFDPVSAHALDGHVLTIYLAVPSVHVAELSASQLRLQHIDVHRFRHHLISITITTTHPTTLQVIKASTDQERPS